MGTLIKLELKRNNTRTYIIACVIIAVVMLCFLYLFAYAPRLEPDDKDMAIFLGFQNLIPLFCVLNMAVFSVLAAVMYSKFIIEDYSGKRALLLFAYPINRKKILLSKFNVVYIFIVIAMCISSLFIFSIFGLTETFLHLVGEKFTLVTMLQAMETTVMMAFVAASTGMIAVGIGFIKTSVPTTIVSAVLIASLICNIVVNAASDKAVLYTISAVVICIGIIFSIILMKKVNAMEVE